MNELTNRQLQAGIVELDRVIALHGKWYTDLLRVLISRVQSKQSELRPMHICDACLVNDLKGVLRLF